MWDTFDSQKAHLPCCASSTALHRLVAIDSGVKRECFLAVVVGSRVVVVLLALLLGYRNAPIRRDRGGLCRPLDSDHGFVPWCFLRRSRDSWMSCIVLACSNVSPGGIGPSWRLEPLEFLPVGRGHPGLGDQLLSSQQEFLNVRRPRFPGRIGRWSGPGRSSNPGWSRGDSR